MKGSMGPPALVRMCCWADAPFSIQATKYHLCMQCTCVAGGDTDTDMQAS